MEMLLTVMRDASNLSLKMIYALHGAVGEASDWNALARDLKSEGHALARVDLWQYLACCPMPIADFGAKFNREINTKNPSLIGYSMGGRLALHALIENPSLWSKAVIVSADTGMTDAQQKRDRASKDAEWAALALRGDWSAFLERWNAQAVLAGAGMPNRENLHTRREQVARSFMDWTVSQQEDLLPELHKITCPVLWVVGAHDTKFLKIAEKAVEALPNAQLLVLDEVGHRVPWEAADQFSQSVCTFLGK